jgi:hypothetical protein
MWVKSKAFDALIWRYICYSRLSWVKKLARHHSVLNPTLPNFVDICSVALEIKHADGWTEEGMEAGEQHQGTKCKQENKRMRK